MLGKRLSEIKTLEERIVALKENSLKKEGENRDLRRKLTSMEDHTESKEETLSRVQSDQEDLEQRYSELHLKYEMVSEEKMKN